MLWSIKEVDEGAVSRLAAACGIHPVVARILVGRGCMTEVQARRFLEPQLTDLHPPEVMPDIERAVLRIRKAIAVGQKIVVWGHDDLDGATSVALLVRCLAESGGTVASYIPAKTKEPHGLNSRQLAEFSRSGVSLVITTDCGITNFTEVKFAQHNGIDVIITDHHELTDGIPEAGAVLDPKRPDSRYPCIDLAGAGVAFKLGQALIDNRGRVPSSFWPELVALAALGTIADRVRLIDENRIFVRFGLRTIAQSDEPPFRALRAGIGLGSDRLTVETITSEVIPVFSSIAAHQTVQFLLEKNYEKAQATIEAVVSRVADFKEEGKAKLEELERQAYLSDNLVVAYDPQIPIRHLGFCATKLRNRFLMPALVMTWRGDAWVGELRGFDGDDLLVLLKSLGNYLVEYGGHKRACGFSLREEQLAPFLNEAQEYARSHFHPRQPKADRTAEGILPRSEFTSDFMKLAPFGPGNPAPLLIEPAPAYARGSGTPVAGLDDREDILYTFDDFLNVKIIDVAQREPPMPFPG